MNRLISNAVTSVTDILKGKKEQFLKGKEREVTLMQLPNSVAASQFINCIGKDATIAFALKYASCYECTAVITSPCVKYALDALEWLFEASNTGELGIPHRSVSVGDIVMVDDVAYVCCSIGWELL
jgi:hypothetical protein